MMNNKEKKMLSIVLMICILIILVLTITYKIKVKNNLKLNDMLIDSKGVVYENVPFEYRKLD